MALGADWSKFTHLRDDPLHKVHGLEGVGERAEDTNGFHC